MDVRVVVSRIAAAAEHGADADFAQDVLEAVSSLVPHDGYCLFGLDPVSGLRTSMLSRHGADGVAARLEHNETVESDVNRYVDLASAPVPVGVLGGSAGSLASPRLADILRPLGIGSELRMSLRTATVRWGGLSLFRARGSSPFTGHDVGVMAALHPALASAARRRPLRTLGPHWHDVRGPGLLLLDPANAVLSLSGEATHWLRELCAGGTDEMDVDDMMRVVFDVATAARRSAGPSSISRIRTPTGRWVALHGTPVSPGAQTVAVIVQAATVDELLPAIAAWAGLTRREQEVVRLAARGLPGKQMATRLGLSPLTVDTHLKSAYRKTGVTGREQLMGQLR